MSRDMRTADLIFDSNCDPFGSNAYANQVFAMHQDGGGLHRLTPRRHVGGESATVIEMPRPFAYPG